MGIIIYLTLAQRGKRIGGDWSLFYAIPMIYRRNDDCFSPVLFFIYLFSSRPSLIFFSPHIYFLDVCAHFSIGSWTKRKTYWCRRLHTRSSVLCRSLWKLHTHAGAARPGRVHTRGFLAYSKMRSARPGKDDGIANHRP